MSLETIVKVRSGNKAPETGVYVLDHKGSCPILDSERMITLVKDSKAPKVLTCQHPADWVLVPVDKV